MLFCANATGSHEVKVCLVAKAKKQQEQTCQSLTSIKKELGLINPFLKLGLNVTLCCRCEIP